jgi:hypothetical protein
VPTAVVGVAAAGRVAALLELVEDRHQVGRIEVQLSAEELLRKLAPVAQLDQRGDVSRPDPVGLKRLGEAVRRDPAQLDHQQCGPLPRDAGRRARRGVLRHAPKVSRNEPLV